MQLIGSVRRTAAVIGLVGAAVSLLWIYGGHAPAIGVMEPDRSAATQRDLVKSKPEPPAGMVYVPGGVTQIGAEDGSADEYPVFAATVRPFFMDVHPVTVAQFRKFVESTSYVTEAERLGDAGVFDTRTSEWRMMRGASWRAPLGKDGPPATDSHPVTQVSWHDASAYADWAGKRLPTEVEWEHAARGGRNSRRKYAWGDALVDRGIHRANTWQGAFPGHNIAEDGHVYTSPVGVFGVTDLGLSDMGGNVWQWVSDWYGPPGNTAHVSAGGVGEKVQRGGSFLCHQDFCHGYRVSARSHSSPETALFHVGFRCAKDVSTP
jgi:sulfatase modifying factor 1